jgi:TRAP-type C4-dicarboxylate transport system permease small subunit
LSNRYIRYVDRITRAVNSVAMVTILLIMVLTLAGIATRLIGIPLSGVTNLSESLLVVAVYLSVAYTQQGKQHVSVELLLASLGERNRRILDGVNILIALVICSVIVDTSWGYALQSWKLHERMDGAPFYPIYPPKIAIAVGMSLLWLQLFADWLRGLLALFMRTKEKRL